MPVKVVFFPEDAAEVHKDATIEKMPRVFAGVNSNLLLSVELSWANRQ